MKLVVINLSSYKALALFVLTIYTFTPFQFSSDASDTISQSQNLTNGDTVISSDGMFELGFFTSGNNSRNWYLGMWYRKLSVRTYIWVANRETPMTDTTGVVLRVARPGILVLLNSSNGVVWSTNTSRTVQNSVAQLLDSGSFVVRDANDDRPENFLWQSFDYPTDTYLPGMKFGWNLAMGLETFFVSWRSDDDPGNGEYSWHLDLTGFPQLLIRRCSDDVVYRFGPWNGIRPSGSPDSPVYKMVFVMNQNEVYYREEASNGSGGPWNGVRLRFSEVQRLTRVDTGGWMTYLTNPADICDTYGLCGIYGQCSVGKTSSCRCLDRFVPRNPDGWVRADWSDGCVRRTNLSCEGDGFLRYDNVKLPDTRSSWYNTSLSLDECRAECLRNCSCMAFAQLDIRRGTGCLMWYRDLIDIKIVSVYGQDIYIRMASSETVEPKGRDRRILIASLTATIGLFFICLSFSFYWRMRTKSKMRENGLYGENQLGDSELPLFDFSVVLKATDHFSSKNKLGEGGFGPVYKGTLEGGQEIAVKRLSKDSSQGIDEFKNEVMLIAKLQHRNLVRLQGYCIQGEDNMLIYEYMPNKSLDCILFDKMNGKLLDWATRFKIINGIARGLMYLHQDSRLRVIHRDLKASNILLDKDMTPKVSDFGLARSFAGNELAANTKRVIGTYGYMSPEYAIDGFFSVKSDVFSFGVLVLEIVIGRRNRGFSDGENHHNLLGHAWILYKEGRSLELIDKNLGDSYSLPEAIKSIHVALLCVQEHPDHRPNMSSVVSMLENEVVLPQAKEPGFFLERTFPSHHTLRHENAESGPNEITISLLEGR